MATYIILNCIFAAAVLILLRIRLRQPQKHTVYTVLILVSLAVVFDSLIVGFDIVRYDTQKILGLYLGLAPIEDFFYAVLAAIVIPVIWNKLGKK